MTITYYWKIRNVEYDDGTKALGFSYDHTSYPRGTAFSGMNAKFHDGDVEKYRKQILDRERKENPRRPITLKEKGEDERIKQDITSFF